MPQRAEASRSITTGGATISALGATKRGRIAMRSPFDWTIEGNSHGSTDPRTLNATFALANTPWAGRQCQTKRPAKSPVKMPRRAEASRSMSTPGGAPISSLGALKRNGMTMRSPFDWRIEH